MSTKEYDGFSDSFRESSPASPSGAPRTGQDSAPAGVRAQAPSPAVTASPTSATAHTTSTASPDLDAERQGKTGSRTAALWVSLILGAAVLILLLVFIVQNNVSTTFDYMSWQFTLPLGVAMLLAAIAGALIMALVGSVRMAQLSLAVRKYRKQEEKLRATLQH